MEGKGGVRRKSVSANDWLRVPGLALACWKGVQAWTRDTVEAERWREMSVGCRRWALYLSMLLLERDGVALAIERGK